MSSSSGKKYLQPDRTYDQYDQTAGHAVSSRLSLVTMRRLSSSSNICNNIRNDNNAPPESPR